MKIIVALRCSWNHCDARVSLWTWTLYADNGNPIARAEYAWETLGSAQRAAREFRRTIGQPYIPIRTAGKSKGR
jgi:hypothetical protein